MLILAIAVVVASWIYCVLVIAASAKYLRSRHPVLAEAFEPISILKPLAGMDEGLEANLRSFFEQDYPNFELLFAVRKHDDPAADLIRRLTREYPAVTAKLIVTGDPPFPHAKIFSLECMLDRSKHDLIVMSDSDIRVGGDFCRSIAAEFHNQQVDLETCPYRAVAGRSLWSRLEAVGMNTDFHAGVLTAVMLEGMKFALGPTLVIRRHVLQAIGGIERLRDYVSEDFMLGRLVVASRFWSGSFGIRRRTSNR